MSKIDNTDKLRLLSKDHKCTNRMLIILNVSDKLQWIVKESDIVQIRLKIDYTSDYDNRQNTWCKEVVILIIKILTCVGDHAIVIFRVHAVLNDFIDFGIFQFFT